MVLNGNISVAFSERGSWNRAALSKLLINSRRSVFFTSLRLVVVFGGGMVNDNQCKKPTENGNRHNRQSSHQRNIYMKKITCTKRICAEMYATRVIPSRVQQNLHLYEAGCKTKKVKNLVKKNLVSWCFEPSQPLGTASKEEVEEDRGGGGARRRHMHLCLFLM